MAVNNILLPLKNSYKTNTLQMICELTMIILRAKPAAVLHHTWWQLVNDHNQCITYPTVYILLSCKSPWSLQNISAYGIKTYIPSSNHPKNRMFWFKGNGVFLSPNFQFLLFKEDNLWLSTQFLLFKENANLIIKLI